MRSMWERGGRGGDLSQGTCCRNPPPDPDPHPTWTEDFSFNRIRPGGEKWLLITALRSDNGSVVYGKEVGGEADKASKGMHH
jgi:hypothetical protein